MNKRISGSAEKIKISGSAERMRLENKLKVKNINKTNFNFFIVKIITPIF